MSVANSPAPSFSTDAHQSAQIPASFAYYIIPSAVMSKGIKDCHNGYIATTDKHGNPRPENNDQRAV